VLLNSGGKEITVYMRESDAMVLGFNAPNYFRASEGKLDYDIKLAWQENNTAAPLAVLATFSPPDGLLTSNDFFDPSMTEIREDYPPEIVDIIQRAQNRESGLNEGDYDTFNKWAIEYLSLYNQPLLDSYLANLLPQVARIEGLSFPEIPTPASLAYVSALATPAALRALALVPQVDGIWLNIPAEYASPRNAQWRVTSGGQAANAAGAYGSGSSVVVMGGGVSPITSKLAITGSVSWDGSPTTDSSAHGHDTLVAWTIKGQDTTYAGIANQASLYNAKVLDWNAPPAGAFTKSATKFCAVEGGTCSFAGTKDVVFGANGQFVYKNSVSGSISCTAAAMGGDPVTGMTKTCFYGDAANH
jgi:hypothetical protein